MATYIENYHDWLRDAHAMEKQAESMLEKMAERLEHYPELRARLLQHLEETRHQQRLLEDVIERNGISHSTLKDAMSKLIAFGQAMGGMMTPDEVVKGAIAGYVFEHFEVACYTSLITAAEQAGDHAGAEVFRTILKEEQAMADWARDHLPQVTQQFLQRSAAPDTEAKK
jgi:ferritin-like metal-binding protein YciE